MEFNFCSKLSMVCVSALNARIKRKESKYVGLTWQAAEQNWRVRIKHEGRLVHAGSHANEKEAALMFDKVWHFKFLLLWRNFFITLSVLFLRSAASSEGTRWTLILKPVKFSSNIFYHFLLRRRSTSRAQAKRYSDSDLLSNFFTN